MKQIIWGIIVLLNFGACLTYKTCVGCDHGFNVKNEDGEVQRNWKKIFNQFIKWTNEN